MVVQLEHAAAATRIGPSASEPPAVVAIGSCRIYEPLRAARDAGHLASLGILFPHIHNPLEIAQALRMLAGGALPPEELWALTNVSAGTEKLRSRAFGASPPTDVMVVELSSLRIVEFCGWQLQINTFRKRLTDEGVPPELIKPLYSDLNNVAVARREILKLDLSADMRRIMKGASFSEMSPHAIQSSISPIIELAGRPILFVGHCAMDGRGMDIRQRRLLNDAIAERVSGLPDVMFFDPTNLVREHGFDEVMLDASHYREAFYPAVGLALSKAVAALSRQSQTISVEDSRDPV